MHFLDPLVLIAVVLMVAALIATVSAAIVVADLLFVHLRHHGGPNSRGGCRRSVGRGAKRRRDCLDEARRRR